MFGWDVSVTKRRGTALYQGTPIEVHLHVERILREGDYMTLVAIYPRGIDEEETALSLMERLEYAI